MAENQNISVSFIIHEAAMARAERHNKRMCVALIIAIIIIFITNGCWLLFISQYDFESYEYSQDGQGVNVIGNENGVEYYGAKIDSPQENEKE